MAIIIQIIKYSEIINNIENLKMRINKEELDINLHQGSSELELRRNMKLTYKRRSYKHSYATYIQKKYKILCIFSSLSYH